MGWLLDTTIRTSARPCNAAWPANGLPKSWTRKSASLGERIQRHPTLRLTDNHTQHTLILEDPIDPDALLSAVDLLSAPEILKCPLT